MVGRMEAVGGWAVGSMRGTLSICVCICYVLQHATAPLLKTGGGGSKRLRPHRPPCPAPGNPLTSGRHLGGMLGHLGGTWGILGHLGGIWEASGRHLGGIWEASWGILGCLGVSGRCLGGVLGCLGGVLGCLGGVLEVSWGVWEVSWRRLGVSWRRLGASWRCLGGVLGCLGGFLLKNIEKPMKIKGFLRFLVIWEGVQGVGTIAGGGGFPAREYLLFHLKQLKSIVFLGFLGCWGVCGSLESSIYITLRE